MLRLFFDTETTGLPKKYGAPAENLEAWDSARLVQLSWILEDERLELSRGDFIIKPVGFEIPKEASDVHGITTMWATSQGVDLKKAVYYFLGAARMADVLVGHNIEFDLGVVGAELIRTWGKNYLSGLKTEDTMKNQAVIDFCAIPKKNGAPGFKYPKLMELYRKLFVADFGGAHNSMYDVEATEKCYWELKIKSIL